LLNKTRQLLLYQSITYIAYARSANGGTANCPTPVLESGLAVKDYQARVMTDIHAGPADQTRAPQTNFTDRRIQELRVI
jgi:hypothetical protein